MLLLDLLVNQGKLSDLDSREIDNLVAKTPGAIVDEVLIKKGIDEHKLAEARSLLFGISLYQGEIVKDATLLKLLTLDQSKQLLAVPLSYAGQVLAVGIVDPDYANALNALQFILGETHIAYKVYLITYSQFSNYINAEAVETKNVKEVEEIQKALDLTTGEKEGEFEGIDPNIDVEEGDANDILKDLVDLTDYDGVLDRALLKKPIPDIFNQILRYGLKNSASDVHIEHIGPSVRARFRVDGELSTALTMPASFHSILVARIKILCSMKLDEKRKPQDGRFSTKLEDHKIDYRVSTFPGYYGEKVVLRILDSYRGIRPVDSIGLTKRHMEQIRDAISKPYGIILVSGPTGSGKTTTLYSLLGEIDREHRNVVSLEDPIEYNISSINQSQVFPEIGYTFASGLRSILRQDPDVIMVGEIRDAETAGLAIQAALTGHLVFSTIHTNTAIGVITRLLDMGIEPYLIAPTLNAAIGQRLVRGIAEGCGKPMKMDPGMQALLAAQFEDLDDKYKKELPLDKPFFDAQGNEQNPSGLKSRLPVFEILTVNEELQKGILHRLGEDEMWSIARKNGMLTMKEDALIKCIEGRVPFVEINSL